MKFFIDLSKKQLIKSAASNVALERVVLKRRDSLAVEVVFVSRNAVATMPAGTTVSVALKKSFADSNFLASASGTPPTLNLNTVPLEALFSATNPSAIPALLEIRWTIPGETTRTATLTAEVQNSVILGLEGTPEAIPDGKATQAQAEAGTDNTKWMTPLRTAQAIAVLAPPPTWDAVQNKPTSFPPSAHTHTASQITDFATAVVAAAPPTTNASLLTSGTLADARLSATAAASLAKADTASQPGHGHATSDIVGLDTALAGKQPAGSYATLDGSGKVPASQLPSFADDVLAFESYSSFPSAGESGKIYIDLATKKLYACSQVVARTLSPIYWQADGTKATVSIDNHGLQVGQLVEMSNAGEISGRHLVSNVPNGNQFEIPTTLGGDPNNPPATGISGSILVFEDEYVEVSPSEVASVAGRTGIVTLGTSDIASASVYFDIADSHPSVNGSYDVWDIDANGRFRWANQNAAAEGAIWTALRWNANRWELGTYTAFTTWTALYFNPSTAVIPPATDWQAVPDNPHPIPTLQWFSQPTADEITSLHAEDSRLQKQLDDQGGINTAAIQTLSTETAAALATKAPLSHKHAGDDVYLSAADEHGPVLLNGFNAGDGIYWPSNTSINARFVYLRRGGSGSTFGLFYQNDAWHQYFGAPNTASILESSDPDGANFPWEAAWNHDVTRATAYDFHRHILEQLQFAGAPRPLAEVTGLQSALDGKASAADLATLNADLATLGEGFSTLYNTVSELGVESITGLPEALTLKADLVNGLVPTTQLPPLSFQTTRYDGDGTAFTFAPPGTLTNSDSPSALSVTINGVTQEPGSDYTLNIATNRVVLTSALPLGDKIVITRPLLLPSASTLTAEQLGALTATSVIDGGSF